MDPNSSAAAKKIPSVLKLSKSIEIFTKETFKNKRIDTFILANMEIQDLFGVFLLKWRHRQWTQFFLVQSSCFHCFISHSLSLSHIYAFYVYAFCIYIYISMTHYVQLNFQGWELSWGHLLSAFKGIHHLHYLHSPAHFFGKRKKERKRERKKERKERKKERKWTLPNPHFSYSQFLTENIKLQK